jgi:hypothetical protein
MNSWKVYHTTSPQQTYIPNTLGMSVTFYNDTDDEVCIAFPDYSHLETFGPREKKYFVRDIDDQILFEMSSRIYNISRYVNNVVIKRVEGGYQPSFFFSTRKFVG